MKITQKDIKKIGVTKVAKYNVILEVNGRDISVEYIENYFDGEYIDDFCSNYEIKDEVTEEEKILIDDFIYGDNFKNIYIREDK